MTAADRMRRERFAVALTHGTDPGSLVVEANSVGEAPVDIVPRACLSLSTCRTGNPVMIWYLPIGSAAEHNSLTLGTG